MLFRQAYVIVRDRTNTHGGRNYKDQTQSLCQAGHSVMVAESVDLLFGEIPLVLHGGRKEVERLEGCGQAMEITQRVAVQGPECIRVVG